MPKSAISRSSSEKTEFQRALLDWYRSSQRPLPWRVKPSLYRTVVSEFMLQQTQVKTVLPYFERWLETFPDFASLASASEEDVLRQWEGLGYYSRARNLHRLAQALVAEPEIPSAARAWRKLPGVGPYTAAAITSIAFGAAEACVDGNVVRIVARLTADSTRFKDGAAAAKHLAPVARELLSIEAPGDHNQAMMELGATVCHRRNPLCLLCPVSRWCAAAAEGSPERYPRLAPKEIEYCTVTRAWMLRRGALLLHRAASGARRLAKIHELPTAAQVGLKEGAFAPMDLIAQRRRTITRHSITELIYRVSPKRRIAPHPELIWIDLGELPAIPVSGPHRRWINEILATDPAARRAVALARKRPPA